MFLKIIASLVLSIAFTYLGVSFIGAKFYSFNEILQIEAIFRAGILVSMVVSFFVFLMIFDDEKESEKITNPMVSNNG